MVVLYQLNCRKVVAQFLGEEEGQGQAEEDYR